MGEYLHRTDRRCQLIDAMPVRVAVHVIEGDHHVPHNVDWGGRASLDELHIELCPAHDRRLLGGGAICVLDSRARRVHS